MGEWFRGLVVAVCLFSTVFAGWGFVWPQTACKTRCLNGGVCTFNYENPTQHRCECLIGVWEGDRCQWKVGEPHTDEYLEEEKRDLQAEQGDAKTLTNKQNENETKEKNEEWLREKEEERRKEEADKKMKSEEDRQKVIEMEREAHRLQWEQDRKKAEEARMEETRRREDERKKQDEEREKRRREWEEKVRKHKEVEEERKKEEAQRRKVDQEQRERAQAEARQHADQERARKDEENRRRQEENLRQDQQRREDEERRNQEAQRIDEERIREERRRQQQELNTNRRPELTSTEERNLDEAETSKPPLVNEDPIWDEYREDDSKDRGDSPTPAQKKSDHIYDDTHLEEYEVISKEEGEYRNDETEEKKMRRMEEEEKRREQEKQIASQEKHEHQDFQKTVVNEERDKSFNDDYWDHTPINPEDEDTSKPSAKETNELDERHGLDMEADSWMMARREADLDSHSISLFSPLIPLLVALVFQIHL